jgi:hypothetical protein
MIFVNDSLVLNQTITLNATAVSSVEQEYAFGTGVFEVKANATSDCGAHHEESMFHIVLQKYECINPYAVHGAEYCDYPNAKLLRCLEGSWITVAENNYFYCTTCTRTCGDGICNCGETLQTCYQDCLHGVCENKYLNSYSCSGNTLQRLYQYVNCSSIWVNLYDCYYGCSNGACKTAPGSPGCSVSIATFDYTNSIVEGSAATITATVTNTGNTTSNVRLDFLLDNSVNQTYSQSMPSGSSFARTFTYRPSAGSHPIKLSATATSCGFSDMRTGAVSVFRPQPPASICNNNSICEPFRGETQENCPSDCTSGTPRPSATNVSITPPSLDTSIYRGRVVSVIIISKESQEFGLSVRGVPAEWISYPGTVQVDMEKAVYIYVTPQELGNYNLTFDVEAKNENLMFSRDIGMYVAPASQEEMSEGIIGQIFSFLDKAWNFLAKNLWGFVVVLVIIVLVVIWIGKRYLRIDIL